MRKTRDIHMKLVTIMKNLVGLMFLSSAICYAEPKQIVCEYFADGEKVAEVGKEYEIQLGDVWRTDIYTFDTDDFNDEKKLASHDWYTSWGFGASNEVPYRISPKWLTFDSESQFPNVISRKDLTIKHEQTSPYKCVLRDLDTTDNVI